MAAGSIQRTSGMVQSRPSIERVTPTLRVRCPLRMRKPSVGSFRRPDRTSTETGVSNQGFGATALPALRESAMKSRVVGDEIGLLFRDGELPKISHKSDLRRTRLGRPIRATRAG
jgi:hypothetical protein